MEAISNKGSLAFEIFRLYRSAPEGVAVAEYKLWDGRIVRVFQNHAWKEADEAVGRKTPDEVADVAAKLAEKLLSGESFVMDRDTDDMLLSLEWTISNK